MFNYILLTLHIPIMILNKSGYNYIYHIIALLLFIMSVDQCVNGDNNFLTTTSNKCSNKKNIYGFYLIMLF